MENPTKTHRRGHDAGGHHLILTLAALAIPFFILFGVQFAEGKTWWEENGRWDVQLPGDIHLYFALIMLNFSWAFGCMYYRFVLTAKITLLTFILSMTFDSKLYDFDSAVPIQPRKSSGMANPALDTTSDIYDTKDY